MKDPTNLAEKVLESISLGIIALNTRGEIVTANKAALQLLLDLDGTL